MAEKIYSAIDANKLAAISPSVRTGNGVSETSRRIHHQEATASAKGRRWEVRGEGRVFAACHAPRNRSWHRFIPSTLQRLDRDRSSCWRANGIHQDVSHRRKADGRKYLV